MKQIKVLKCRRSEGDSPPRLAETIAPDEAAPANGMEALGMETLVASCAATSSFVSDLSDLSDSML